MIKFQIDKNKVTDFPHYWEMCVGSCRAYTALREDYRKQLKRAHDELGFQYVRFHGLLNDDMSVLTMKKDYFGNELGLVYNFANVDNIFDFLLDIGMKPFIELAFMPTALASGDKTIFHYKGNITPPKDYDAWAELIRRLTEHLLERYGIEEVSSWFFEVWNEPNLFAFFSGTKEEYFKLYEVTAKIIKGVNVGLKVGGPATSCNSWIKDTVDYCESNQVPLDFITTHHYPTDDPLWKSGMDILDFYQSDLPRGNYERGVLHKMTLRVREEAGNYPVYFTEWNTSAMTNDHKHDESFAAAMVAKVLADNDGLVDGYAFWTFTDIFEESAQIPGVFHGGFGLQTYAGIAKPVYRTFELFHGLGDKRLGVTSSDANTNVEMIATATENGYRVILHNHNIPDEPIKDEEVELDISDLGEFQEILAFHINEDHTNPKRLWQQMGSKEYISRDELGQLHEASKLQQERLTNESVLRITVPAYGVVALDLLI
jgi:xylan 1,4-beta-xylosidase